VHGTAASQRFGRALREGDEPCFSLLHQFGHAGDAILDRYIGVNPRHAEDIEALDAEVLQALLAGLTQIARIATATDGLRAASARTAALGMDDDIMPAATDRFADETVIVALTVARRCVEKIDPEIKGAPDRRDRLVVVGRAIHARHAVAAETDDRYLEIGVAEFAPLHRRISLHWHCPSLPNKAKKCNDGVAERGRAARLVEKLLAGLPA
jgi:hypothetical protein